MHYLIRYIAMAVGSALLLLSEQSLASCWLDTAKGTTAPTNYSYNIPSTAFTLARDFKPGTAITSVFSVPQGPTAWVACDAVGMNMLKLETTLEESDYPGIYKTNVPGIGIKIWDDWSTYSSPSFGMVLVTLSKDLQYWYNWRTATAVDNVITFIKFQFYAIGPIAAGNVQLEIPTVSAWSNTTVSEVGAVKYGTLNITGGFPVTVRSCKTPDISVNLGKHSNSDFPAVNSTSAATPFNFVINDCDPNMNSVSYTFAPATGISINGSGAYESLTLDSASSASGVGIQVLYNNDTLVPFNSKITYTGYNKTTGGSYTIPMKARYIRTGAVTAGTANSAVEFIMTYE